MMPRLAHSECKKMFVRLIALLPFSLLSISTQTALNVTITGKDFYLDGKPWLPKGVNVAAFVRPLHVGVIGWSIDASANLIKDHTDYEPTDYTSFKDCNDGSDSGGGRLLTNFSNN